METRNFVVISVIAAAVLLSSTASAMPHTALTIRVLAHRDECFYQDIDTAGTKVYFHYLVTSGGSGLDIDAAIIGPGDDVIWSAERDRESRILFKVRSPGEHKFCFSNKMSSLSVKTVAFDFQIADWHEREEENSVEGGVFASVPNALRDIETSLSEIREAQGFLRTRERVHREFAEISSYSVIGYGMVEVGFIIVMSLGQVIYLKRCFETRRMV